MLPLSFFQALRPKTITRIKIIIAKIAAITGAAIARTDIRPAPAVSVVPTTEFPSPPVVAVEAARIPANPVLMVAAVPPPAINANPQVNIGSKFSIVDAIATVPAIPAKGNEIVSNKLSTNVVNKTKYSFKLF